MSVHEKFIENNKDQYMTAMKVDVNSQVAFYNIAVVVAALGYRCATTCCRNSNSERQASYSSVRFVSTFLHYWFLLINNKFFLLHHCCNCFCPDIVFYVNAAEPQTAASRTRKNRVGPSSSIDPPKPFIPGPPARPPGPPVPPRAGDGWSNRLESILEAAARPGEDTLQVKMNRCNILFIGPPRVGKTTTMDSIIGNPFNDKQKSTIGVSQQDVQARFDQTTVQGWAPVIGGTTEEFKRIIRSAMLDAPMAASKESSADSKENSVDSKEQTFNINDILQLFPKHDWEDLENKKTILQTKRAKSSSNSPPQEPHEGIKMATLTDADCDQRSSDTKADLLKLAISLVKFSIRESDLMNTQDSGSGIIYSLWDFAGQDVFYDLLHIMMTRCA